MILDSLESFFKERIVASIDAVLFFDVAFWDNGSEAEIQLPIVVLWLVLGALFFTVRFQFINFRGFRHAIDCVRGRYSQPGETGDITHFQALSAALSATVGLGNIAGVAFAVGVGGPGAVFWMVVAGFLGMSSKFVECTLGQKYRVLRSDGRMSGGPMHYLRDGLAERGLGGLGRFLSVLFALMCIGGSFGGGNMYQSNQAFAQVSTTFAQSAPWLGGDGGAVGFGLILALAVGAVIIGGIKRIGQVAAVLVPIMCVVYVASGLLILTINASAVPSAIGVVVR
ncbi:MAG: alanine:cation symporter family protein, partial [Myxococcota bacterium]